MEGTIMTLEKGGAGVPALDGAALGGAVEAAAAGAVEGAGAAAQASALELKFTTPLQGEREERDRAIFEEWKALTGNEGQSRTEVVKYLMRKYELHSTSTIYAILKRVEARSAKEGGAA